MYFEVSKHEFERSSQGYLFFQTEPEKTMEKDKIATSQPQNTLITNTSLPRPKTAPKQQIIQREPARNSFTWLEETWNGISSVVESIVKWLCFDIEWLKDSNSDKFARRTVTRSDLQTCPADVVCWFSYHRVVFT